MTTFDRFERDIPELMTELAPSRVPDYFDDMLRQTARTRQRPAWSSLERWLPMDVTALSAPTRRVPWRYLAIAVAALLIVAASLVYVGSRSHALPPPFGPARNGLIVYATLSGDIASYDPATRATRTLVSSDAHEAYPLFTNDGTRLLFGRTPDKDHESDYLANADGSDVRDFIADGPPLKWLDWSASGDRAVVTRTGGTGLTFALVDTSSGNETPIALDPALGITGAMTWPGHDELIYVHVPDQGAPGTKAWIGRTDGSGLRPIPLSPDAVNDLAVSPDGRSLAYASWGSAANAQGRIHLVDLTDPAHTTDTPRMFDGSAGTIELMPLFSPDSRSLLVQRFTGDDYRLVVVPVAGAGAVVPIGPIQPANGSPTPIWSPDGTQILAAYPGETHAWLLPVDGSAGTQLDGLSADEGYTWQRLAP